MSHSAEPSAGERWAIGGVVFGATSMLLIGVWQILMGIAVLVDDALFVLEGEYAYEFDTAAWGWTHLAVGILVFLVGLAIFSGAIWARVLGIFLALIVAIANFFFLPYFPLWSIVVIALAVFVIWALAHAPRSGRSRGTRSMATE